MLEPTQRRLTNDLKSQIDQIIDYTLNEPLAQHPMIKRPGR